MNRRGDGDLPVSAKCAGTCGRRLWVAAAPAQPFREGRAERSAAAFSETVVHGRTLYFCRPCTEEIERAEDNRRMGLHSGAHPCAVHT